MNWVQRLVRREKKDEKKLDYDPQENRTHFS